MKSKFFMLVIVTLLIASSAFADAVWNEYPNGNAINEIAFQGDYVWSATEGCLVRWDKRDGSYRQFTVNDGLLANRTMNVFTDRDGNLWIGSREGIQKYDGVSYTDYTMDNSDLPYQYVLAMAQAPDGTIWFGTHGGLICFDGETWIYYNNENGAPDIYYINDLAVDKDGVLWFPYVTKTGFNGVMSFDGETWNHYTRKTTGLNTEYIFHIVVDDNNVKWFGTPRGLKSFDGENWVSHDLPEYKYKLSIADLAVDGDGNVWVATMPGLVSMVVYYPDEKKTILRYDGSTWTELPVDDYLQMPVNGFQIIDVDDEGIPWFVSRNNGMDARTLYSYDVSGMTEYLIEGPRSYIFKDIFVDSNNTTWFASSYGLSRFIDGSWEDMLYILPEEEYREEYYQGERHYSISYSLGANEVESIVEDQDGVLWFATNFGIRSYDGSSWTQYSEVNVDAIPNASSLFAFAGVDNNNVKYFLSPVFLLTYDGQNWVKDDWLKDNFDNGHSLRGFTHAALDQDNILWLINYKGKIVRYDGDSWEVLEKETTGLGGYGYCCAVDHNNVKWFGTSEGLYSFDGSSWKTHLDEEVTGSVHGIPHITVDENNILWLINNKKLQSYDGNSLITHREELSGYTIKMDIDQDGFIWIGGLEGAGSSGMVSFNKNAVLTAVDTENDLPAALNINGNYPNPFNPSTTISFALETTGFASLEIYNVAGQKVRTLVAEHMNSGVHNVVWNGRDESGNAVSSGVYMCRLKMGEQAMTRQMMLLK